MMSQFPGARTVQTTRTFFPEILQKSPNHDLLFIGCLKAIEETGQPGWLYLPDGRTHEVSSAKVNIIGPTATA